jgi:hypothetical protein
MAMKFTLSTAGLFYPGSERRGKLEEIGFKFKPYHYKEFIITNDKPTIEINSLEELVAFADEWDEIIVRNGEIEIYDDYRE